jgi:hypothetical protein
VNLCGTFFVFSGVKVFVARARKTFTTEYTEGTEKIHRGILENEFGGDRAVRKALLGAGLGLIALTGAAIFAGAQGPPPGRFGERGAGPGGAMAGMFEFGRLMGGFGGKVVAGKPFQANFTITHTETMPGNTITNTTTGTFARAADGSTYRDVKLAAIGPWAASGKAQEFAYIRNVSKATQNIVNVTKGTYQAFPMHVRPAAQGSAQAQEGSRAARPNRSNSPNETVTDNPNGTYTDPATNTVYPADDRKTTRTIPAGAIGNANAIVITSERWYSPTLDLVLEETRTDPRFGTTTYQLTNIGQSPSAALFTPDPSFSQVQGRAFGPGAHRGQGKPAAPPAAAPAQD